MQIIQIFLASFIVTFSFFVFGNFISKKVISENTQIKISLECIYGSILISFFSLFLNFFIPINKMVGNIFILLSLFLFIILLKFKKIKFNFEVFISLLLISLISLILILYSNINRPDAGLYHLPYVKIIQDYKIIFGLSNIHHRFGHISIVQYLSSIYNNSLFPKEIFLLPLSILVSSFYFYIISHFRKKKNLKNDETILIFFIGIFVFYSFNRYSNFGNDATSHIFFFLFLIQLFKFRECINNIDSIANLSLLSTFAFLQKTSMILILIVPFVLYLFFFIKNFEFYKNKKILLSFFFIIFWILKNTIVSGCIIYPVSLTCINNFEITNYEETKYIENETESWAKDWPNKKNKSIKMIDYNKNLNWFSTWKENHFKFVQKKFLPFLITILILFIVLNFIYKKKKFDKNDEKIDKLKYLICFSLCMMLSMFWFLKFPVYRFGQSYISGTLIVLFSYLFVVNIELNKIKYILRILIIVFFIGAISKNLIRIYDSHNFKNPWPNIYTLSENKSKNIKRENIPIFYDNEFVYFFSKTECLFNESPCSNYLKKNIIKTKKYSYEFFISKSE